MDTKTLDTFTQFVDFVKNVDKFSGVVDQLKQATQDNQQALDLLTEGKSLQAFSDKLDSVEARLVFERQEFDKASKAQNDVLAQRAKDLNDREEDLNNFKAHLNDREGNLNKFSADLTKKGESLSKMESDLNAQIDRNNLVASDLAKRVALVLQAVA